jgi:hypothetical protein
MLLILVMHEANIGCFMVQSQQEVAKTPPQPIKSWEWWPAPVIPAAQEGP